MKTVHAYQRGCNGWGIFYQREDLLVYTTLFSVISKEMGLHVIAFSPMFNHTHSGFAEITSRKLETFHRRLNAIFVREYNQHYQRSGSLLQSPFGQSEKYGGKTILGNVAYIFNNCVAGKMYLTAVEYRWTLLAYRNSRHPFSEQIHREHRSNRMRKAMSRVDYCLSRGWYLNYSVLRDILDGLDEKETEQLTDYILSKYNFLDYSYLDKLYDSYESLLLALKSTAGTEYDLAEEYEDHSCYMKMLKVLEKYGYRGVNVESLDYSEKNKLIRYINRTVSPTRDQIWKFFHLK